MLYRALIRTHHMTSRKKIQAIAKSTKKYDCAVYLRTGTWRGVMIAENDNDDSLKGWVGDVKRLRYKDFQHVISEPVRTGKLDVPPGSVREFDSLKALGAELRQCGIFEWWNQHMGFARGEVDD